jgi:hypothetical protein
MKISGWRWKILALSWIKPIERFSGYSTILKQQDEKSGDFLPDLLPKIQGQGRVLFRLFDLLDVRRYHAGKTSPVCAYSV